MALVQGRQFSAPAIRLRVVGVSPFALGQHAPDGVYFAMLTQEMTPAEARRIDVPDAHCL
jgi:hypothetical protein